MKFAIQSKRVLLETGIQEASLIIENGKIVELLHHAIHSNELVVHDYDNCIVMPGLIDSHVHINEPGRTDWEGFDTACKAAAAGGITTLIDMPLNSSPVTTHVKAFHEKIRSAENKLHVNCGFWGGLVPDNIEDLEDLLDSGVLGLKAFLCPSGIDEFPEVKWDSLYEAALILKKYNLPLLAHGEIENKSAINKTKPENNRSYDSYLKSRPKSWENEAIKMLIKLSQSTGVQVHVVHLSSSDGIELIRAAKSNGTNISTETCPHYLYFNAESIKDGSTLHKCAPPIRELKNNKQLWAALVDSVIDFIVTDHSPAPPELKASDSGNFNEAWGGIAGLQFSLPAVWSKAKEYNLDIASINSLMSYNVAQFLGLADSKGKLSLAYDADICVFDPESQFCPEEDDIHHKHKISPYVGEELNGKIIASYVMGHRVFHDGRFESLSKGSIIRK